MGAWLLEHEASVDRVPALRTTRSRGGLEGAGAHSCCMPSLLPPDLDARLGRLYAALDEALEARRPTLPPEAGVPANPCGSCHACCSAQGRRRQRVTRLELAYLERHGGAAVRLEAFEAYLWRDEEPDGALLHPVCPHYHAELGGCTVYSARPYSCRVFGHWRLEGSGLPEGCTFTGSELEFSVASYLSEVPFARELVELEVELQGRRGLGRAAPSELPGGEVQLTQGAQGPEAERVARVPAPLCAPGGLPAQPPPPLGGIERALYHQQRGERAEAHQAFEQASQRHPGSAWTWQAWGALWQLEGKPGEAATCYARAASLDPGSAEHPCLLGLARLEAGQPHDALEALLQSLRIDPQQARLLAVCAHLYLGLGRPQEAVTLLEEALARGGAEPQLAGLLEAARARFASP